MTAGRSYVVRVSFTDGSKAGPPMTHFAACKGNTVVQKNGIAPLRFEFVGPAGAPTAAGH